MAELIDFVRDRWAILGGKSGLKGIKEAGGPDIGTVRNVCKDPGLPQERDTDSRRELAHMLRFKSWDDLLDAWRSPPSGLTRHAVISLDTATYVLALQQSAAKRMKIDDWVAWAVFEAAKKR